MAATVSAWAKPGAWALDSEEHEAELLQQAAKDETDNNRYVAVGRREEVQLGDFPSLATAATTKTKKKKGQTISLAEFTNGPAKTAPSRQTLTQEDLLILPTGPRERTAEELDRSRLGGGFRSYGANSRYSNGEDSSNSRWGSARVSDDSRKPGGFGRDSSRELAPSRADEIDDWGANKKSAVGGSGFERRERGERGDRGGFFNSQSRADESDTWVSNKSFVPSEGRRFGSSGGGAFDSLRERRGDNGSGIDSDNWGKKSGGAFDSIRDRRGGFDSGLNGGGTDSDNWGKKREDGGVVGVGVGGRPKLNLQPRTLPVEHVQPNVTDAPVVAPPVVTPAAKPKGFNPFGEARPREEVLKEKGQDWKEIDEKLESVKIKETTDTSFGNGHGRTSLPEGRAERAWRKPDSSEPTSQSDETIENGHAEEEEASSRDVQQEEA